MPVVLDSLITSLISLAAAAAYGVGDFFGALASKRSNPIWVSFVGHAFYFLTALLLLPLIGGVWSIGGSIVGFGTGTFEAIGFLLFYYALTYGPVAIVSPLVSLVYSLVPVVIGASLGNEISMPGWVGIGLAMLAVLALTTEPQGSADAGRKSLGFVVIAVISGIAWGLSTVVLAFAPSDSGMTPVVIGGLSAFAWLCLVVLAVPAKVKGRFERSTLHVSALSGIMFALANYLIISALRSGDLALVGALTALYPLATVLLARVVLKEKITKLQWFGIALAVVAAVLLSQG